MTPATYPVPLSASSAPSTWHSTLRACIVIVIAVLAAMSAGADIVLPWYPFSSFGYDAAPDGRIANVVDGMPAQRAGLHVGDQIDLARLSLHDRRFIGQLSVAPRGETVTFHVTRANASRDVTLKAVPRARTVADNVTDVVLVASEVAFMAIGAILVLLRPSVVTWAFFIFACGSGNSISFQEGTSDRLLFAVNALQGLMVLATGPATVAFAMLFPRTQPSRSERAVIRGLAIASVALALLNLASGYAPATDSVIFIPQFSDVLISVNSIAATLCYAAAVLIFILNYLRSDDMQRKRMQWVALGFALGSGLLELLIISEGFMSITPPLWLLNLLQCFNILVPISVAYAILKHRVIDIRFFASRALVYGAITTGAVAILALLEFFVARSIETRNLGLIVEIAGAVAVGVGMNRAHGTIDRAVDRFVFRSVHLAEQHLQRVGSSLMFAQSTAAIDRTFAEEAMRALDLDAVRVVREFDPDNSLVMLLNAQREQIEDSDQLYVPMFVRHQLLGYAVFGHHRNGAAIDPNERTILTHLTRQAAIAYDHVMSEERTAEHERIRAELVLERAKNDQLAALLRSQ
jgi:hypothetical protein